MDALSRYLRPPARQNKWLWSLIAAGALLAVWAGFSAYRQHDRAGQTAELHAKLLAAQARNAAAPSRTEQEDQKRWTALKVERDFAWEPLFRAVESATGADIELLELQPDKNNRRVVLRGEARDRKALISFVAALASQAALGNVHLVRTQATSREGLETEAFEIKATLVKY